MKEPNIMQLNTDFAGLSVVPPVTSERDKDDEADEIYNNGWQDGWDARDNDRRPAENVPGYVWVLISITMVAVCLLAALVISGLMQ